MQSQQGRGERKPVLRLKFCGGVLTKEQTVRILQCVEKNNISSIKLSTGQTLQIQGLTGAAAEEMKTGNSSPVIITAPPLSGVAVGEYFDVLPYVQAVDAYMQSLAHVPELPQKLKIAFSNTPKNETHSTFRDLGFAANADGTFDVYMAGGLGIGPKMGILVKEGMDPAQILYYVRAVMNIFMTYGSSGNPSEQKPAGRSRFRSRRLQETMGAESLRELVQQEVSRLMSEENKEADRQDQQLRTRLSMDICSNRFESDKVIKRGADRTEENFRIRRQRQEGMYAVYYHPFGGYMTTTKLRELYRAMPDMQDTEIRLSPDGGLFVINCLAREAEMLYELTKQDSAECAFQTSAACAGRGSCRNGAGDSQKLLADCLTELSEDMDAMRRLPQVRISGCASSCAAQPLAPLGFRGVMKRSAEGPRQAFYVYYGGSSRRGEERLAESAGCIFAAQIPAFMHELADILKTEGTDYETWLQEHLGRMQELIDQYSI